MTTRRVIPVDEAAALTGNLPLQQDPHALRNSGEKRLEVAIGLEVRMLRKHIGLTVAELADKSGVSLGMLSKIENGLTSPSLTTLQAIASSLGVQLSQLMRRFEEKRPVHLVKAGTGATQKRRGTRAGHQYQLLGYLGSNDSGVIVEPYLIVLTSESDVFPTFQHQGLEFLHMLEGSVEYRHGDNVFLLESGDSLFFHADAPHGPEQLITLPARYLSVISYPQGGSG